MICTTFAFGLFRYQGSTSTFGSHSRCAIGAALGFRRIA